MDEKYISKYTGQQIDNLLDKVSLWLKGGDSENGATFYPHVTEDGTLSWENDKNLANPPAVNIHGPKGDDGICLCVTCVTQGESAEKKVDANGFDLSENAMIAVRFAEENTAEDPTLNVNGTGAKPMILMGESIKSDLILQNSVFVFVFDGENWQTIGGGNSVETMTGATEEGPGIGGAVPAPAAGEQENVLTGGGVWKRLTASDVGAAGKADDPIQITLLADTWAGEDGALTYDIIVEGHDNKTDYVEVIEADEYIDNDLFEELRDASISRCGWVDNTTLRLFGRGIAPLSDIPVGILILKI